jgi:hypothetical protein
MYVYLYVLYASPDAEFMTIWFFYFYIFSFHASFDFSFYVRYSTLLHLPPLRFHWLGLALTATRSNYLARSHPHPQNNYFFVKNSCSR